MPASQTPKRLMPDALGMKALITTTSLAVTLGGWSVLALGQLQAPAPEAPSVASAAIDSASSGFELRLQPLPTIAAAPPPPPQIVIATPPPAPAANATRHPAARPASQPASSPAVAQPAAPQPVAPQPPAAPEPPAAAAPAASPPLRMVSAPPKPVTRTRSSR